MSYECFPSQPQQNNSHICITEAYQVGVQREQLANSITLLPPASASLKNFFYRVVPQPVKLVMAVILFRPCKLIKNICTHIPMWRTL